MTDHTTGISQDAPHLADEDKPTPKRLDVVRDHVNRTFALLRDAAANKARRDVFLDRVKDHQLTHDELVEGFALAAENASILGRRDALVTEIEAAIAKLGG